MPPSLKQTPKQTVAMVVKSYEQVLTPLSKPNFIQLTPPRPFQFRLGPFPLLAQTISAPLKTPTPAKDACPLTYSDRAV